MCEHPLALEELQQNAQVRCIIYENLHNTNPKKPTDLKYTKDMWDRLVIILGGDRNKNGEVKKSRKKINKKDSQKRESRPINEAPA